MQVEAHATERAQRKIKRHPSQATSAINETDIKMRDATLNTMHGLPDKTMEIQKILFNKGKDISDSDIEEDESEDDDGIPSHVEDTRSKPETISLFKGGPSKWDPYSKGILAPRTMAMSPPPFGSEVSDRIGVKEDMDSLQRQNQATEQMKAMVESGEKTAIEAMEDINSSGLMFPKATDIQSNEQHVKAIVNEPQSLQDAVKHKARKKKKKGSLKQES